MNTDRPQLVRQATFELVAEVLRREYVRPRRYGVGQGELVAEVARSLADEFAKTNPRFNRTLFLLQIGVDG